MEDSPFENNELCDGGCCPDRHECRRYMGNVDINDESVNPYVIFNCESWPFGLCPYFLTEPDPHYPQSNMQYSN